ncbi:MAG: RraA family protein [Kordiimonadaceae bacterium]|jgi:4-hydroxy-4-methyl-2-oxoglutarate aldolase|nr:RraA family protein [Kordiimonadaceae bacterium]MBT6037428.1 RraA family protein [Kordiimonadaceae bacterium]MBT6329934.1 RraA family protein [Kordiimonadaceae bacterium]MBT7582212.1 RraA family protein [Kordiimonadaceae bacterium]
MTDVSEGQKQLNICKEKLYAAVIADTLDTLGYHNQVLYPGLKALDNTLILCGFARVGLYMPVYHDDEDMNVYEKEIALVDSLKPGEVAVLVCHGNKRISPWGELLSERSTYLGAAGCLTDGCVRDTKQIIDLKFPVYSNGTNPADTKYRGKMMLSDVPGEIGGVSVERGDLVFGDGDGIVIIPKDIIGEVVEKSLEKVSAENTVRDEIHSGESLVDIFDRYKIL